MSYRNERDTFIAQASKEGLSLYTIGRLLRYATTLQRLAEAQCNGDWPYNGDRDRPFCTCTLDNIGHQPHCFASRERHDKRYTTCPKCEASGVAKTAMRFSSTMEHTNSDGVGTGLDSGRIKICPDCRTQELVRACLAEASQQYWKEKDLATCEMDNTPRTDYPFKAHFAGDPRGAVLVLETPGYPWSDDGVKGRGLYVPAR